MGLFDAIFGKSKPTPTFDTIRGTDINAVFLVVEERIGSSLLTSDAHQVAEYATRVTRDVMGSYWRPIHEWMNETDQLISVAQMDGQWDNSRLIRTVKNAFGRIPQLRTSKGYLQALGMTSNGAVGVVVAVK